MSLVYDPVLPPHLSQLLFLGWRDLPRRRCDNSLLPPPVAPPVPPLASSTKAQNFLDTSKIVRKSAGVGVDDWLDMQFGEHGQIAVL